MQLFSLKIALNQTMSEHTESAFYSGGGGGGVLPYMGYIGMCLGEGYGFQAIY